MSLKMTEGDRARLIFGIECGFEGQADRLVIHETGSIAGSPKRNVKNRARKATKQCRRVSPSFGFASLVSSSPPHNSSAFQWMRRPWGGIVGRKKCERENNDVAVAARDTFPFARSHLCPSLSHPLLPCESRLSTYRGRRARS